MKTYVIGAGGVGGYYCGLLARSGADVTLVCRPAVSKILRDEGLTVIDRGEKFKTRDFAVVDSIANVSAPELILLAVKSYHLYEVAEQLAPMLSDQVVIVTLQNGIDADLRVRKYLQQAKIFPGLTWILSTVIQPGVVEQKAPRTFIKFGARNPEVGDLLSEVSNFLEKAGVHTHVSNNIIRDLWEKFIWLVNFAGMAGTQRKPIGLIVNDPEGFELWSRALDETLAVAKALSIPFDPNMRNIILEKLENYKVKDTDFKPSLLKDLENGRDTEIEALSGTLVKLAQRAGVKVPIHQMFYDTISARQVGVAI